MWFRRKAPEPETSLPTVTTLDAFEAERARLETKLAQLIEETERTAQLKLLEWKIRKAEERKAWLVHGITMPKSPHDEDQDRLFGIMEQRMRQEEQEAVERVQKAERAEHARLRMEEERLIQAQNEKEKARLAIENRDRADALARERLRAEQAMAETLAKALRADMQ